MTEQTPIEVEKQPKHMSRSEVAFASADSITANIKPRGMHSMIETQPAIALLLAAILEELQTLNASLIKEPPA